MELWIRSQDKEKLLKVDEMHLGLNKQYVESNIWVNNFIVGEYTTKERALEVLDEIQKIWCPPTNFIVSQHIDFDNNGEGLIGCNVLKEEPKIERISDVIVYQMPKE